MVVVAGPIVCGVFLGPRWHSAPLMARNDGSNRARAVTDARMEGWESLWGVVAVELCGGFGRSVKHAEKRDADYGFSWHHGKLRPWAIRQLRGSLRPVKVINLQTPFGNRRAQPSNKHPPVSIVCIPYSIPPAMLTHPWKAATTSLQPSPSLAGSASREATNGASITPFCKGDALETCHLGLQLHSSPPESGIAPVRIRASFDAIALQNTLFSQAR